MKQCVYEYIYVKPSVLDELLPFCDGQNGDSAIIWMSNLLENKSEDWVMEHIPEATDYLELDAILFLVAR